MNNQRRKQISEIRERGQASEEAVGSLEYAHDSLTDALDSLKTAAE